MKKLIIFMLFVSGLMTAQTPVSNFSLMNPVCSQIPVQITDLSSNSPTSWSYTITGGGGPGGGVTITSSLQNPTVNFNVPGIYTITLVAGNSSGPGTPAVQTLTVLQSPFAQINPQQVNNCPGGSPVTITVFSPLGGVTYSWSTSSTTSSIVVMPSVTTVYTCVITGTNGCSVVRASTVNIAQATVNINATPVNICPGTASTLNATGTQPGPFTYSWSTGATTRTISTSTPGVYTVTVVNNNGCSAVQTYSLGTSTTLSLITTSNPTILCAGSTATLRAQGATTYTWNNGVSVPNITVNPLSTTSYTVFGDAGSCSGMAVITLSVNVTPTVVATATPTSICAGSTATLSAGGAASYTWNPGGNGASIVVTPSSGASYVLSGSVPGCPTRSVSVYVQVNQAPALSVSSSSALICPGEVVGLAVNGAASYTWDNGSNSSVLIVSPTVTTVYTVTGTSAAGCSAAVTFTQSVSDCSGISVIRGHSPFLIFPNPSNGHITLTCDRTATVMIMDLAGSVVAVAEAGEAVRYIDLGDLLNGVYIVKTSAEGNTRYDKIIINR